MNTNTEIDLDEDLFADIDDMLELFDGQTVDGGADPSTEDDNCAGGACKI